MIAVYWLGHHRLVGSFAAIDRPLIALNLALIAVVVLIPFTTDAMGGEDLDDLALPTAVYAVNIACASILFAVVYAVARRRRLLRREVDQRKFRLRVLDLLVPTVVFLASVPVAYAASAEAARLSWLGLAVLGPIAHRAAHRP